ncbi:MAG TPA: hypothetical protein VFI31_08955 [Pirellulales bacterium]|nr:hypothetical protein [Pirellulales bacterium]
MFVTLMAALALSVAQIMRVQRPFAGDLVRSCIEWLLFATYCAVVSVGWVRATLGQSHFVLRAVTALGLQACVYAMGWFALSWPEGRALHQAAGLAVATLILVASLLVGRSAGYRVVAGNAPSRLDERPLAADAAE